MSQQIYVGNFPYGYTTNPLAFNIDNKAFPLLLNAYQWRGRIKRKRGTSFFGRLTRYLDSTLSSYTGTTLNPSFTITFDSGGNANLFGPYTNATPISFSLQSVGNIVPGSVSITASGGPTTYTDPTGDGYLTPTGTGGSNTINYSTGAILIPAQANNTATVKFFYYPDLPVMGIEDLILDPTKFPGSLGFDTVYSYNLSTAFPYAIYDVSFYKNPPLTGAYPGYIPKTSITPTTWNGQDYQQFWSTNYQGAFWVTNGINVPFSVTNIGMQYKPIVAVTVTSGGPPAIVNLEITAHGLVVGDFLFINEVVATTGINLQTGYVIAVVNANNVTVEFPDATIATNGTGGIAQYLTNRSDPTKDCLRWYDGDPTNGTNSNPPVLTGNNGWVNFAPPLSSSIFSIDDTPAAIYYLVGARIILPFKDRLLFLGPVIQTSSLGSQIYLPDTVIYSENGTPYYTASFTGDNLLTTTVFTPILTPPNQSASPNAYFSDVTGYGGYVTAGLNQPIITAGFNEDVMILGFSNLKQARFVYTGNDIVPFNFFVINSEYGSESTFSAITMDRGIETFSNHGIVLTSQIASQRVDLQIPDQIFEFNLQNNGTERITAQRDFINEWIYFSYPSNMSTYKFPNQTLQYNYRDETWAVFNESYTTYGQFRKVSGYTWATIGMKFPTWESWNEPWNAGISSLLQPIILAGNQQGFILVREQGTDESNSLTITSIVGALVTSPNHCLNNNDYIVISGALGTVGSLVNGNIFQVTTATTNTFVLNPGIGMGTYFGGGLIQRMYVPLIMTKQFPVAWEMDRKTRLGKQSYLFTTTPNGQIELQIYLSQNAAFPYNFGPVLPAENSMNDGLIYQDTLYTCPESENIGLTPANVNLQTPTASNQAQIWHRMNTSLIGDTIQIGFTLSDAQMRDPTFSNQFTEIELHAFILTVSPSQLLV
jgi:hypothetical protein